MTDTMLASLHFAALLIHSYIMHALQSFVYLNVVFIIQIIVYSVPQKSYSVKLLKSFYDFYHLYFLWTTFHFRQEENAILKLVKGGFKF